MPGAQKVVGGREAADAVRERHVERADDRLAPAAVILRHERNRRRALLRSLDLASEVVCGQLALNQREGVFRVLDVPVVERHLAEVHVVLVGDQARGNLHAAAAVAADTLDRDAAIAFLLDVDAPVEAVDDLAVAHVDGGRHLRDVDHDVAVRIGRSLLGRGKRPARRERHRGAGQRLVLIVRDVHRRDADLLIRDDKHLELGIRAVDRIGARRAVLPQRAQEQRCRPREATEHERTTRDRHRRLGLGGFRGSSAHTSPSSI